MAVAYSIDFSIGIFTSPDLIDWTATSNFTLHGLIGLQYECPNLIQIPYIDARTGERQDDMWLMYISISPGAPLGGSIGQYFPGTFNGTHFEAVDAVTRIADFGKDNYAGQWFYGLSDDELPVSIAWSSNWQYASDVPTGDELFRSSMSLPRQNYLTRIERVGWKLVSVPYDISPVVGETLESNEDFGNGDISVDFAAVESNAVLLQVNTTSVPTSGRLTFTFTSPSASESIRGGFRFGGDTTVFIDRGSASAFSDNPFFTDKFSVTTLPRNSDGDVAWTTTVVMDRSMLEVFVDGGIESATNTFFAKEPLTQFDLVGEGLAEDLGISVRVSALTSGWA
jgi:beta-fructofuranosidase